MFCADCFLTVDANNNLSVKYVLSENAMMVILKGIFNYIVELIGTLFVENRAEIRQIKIDIEKNIYGLFSFILWNEFRIEIQFEWKWKCN